jgi:hypothetical protein
VKAARKRWRTSVVVWGVTTNRSIAAARRADADACEASRVPVVSAVEDRNAIGGAAVGTCTVVRLLVSL